MAKKITTVITPYTTTPSRLKPATFSSDRDIRLVEENIRNAQLNDIAGEINDVAEEAELSEISAAQNKNLAETSKNAAATSASTASTAASTATTKANEILNYVIPAGAALSIDQSNTAKTAMSKAAFNALARDNRDKFAGSGFVEWGKNYGAGYINNGLYMEAFSKIFIGRRLLDGNGVSKTQDAYVNIDGNVLRINGVNSASTTVRSAEIVLPDAQTVHPYTATLTAEQIASGVIKHADASNSGLIVNGKFDVDTSGWTGYNSNRSVVDGKIVITPVLSGTNGVFAISSVLNCAIGKKYIVEYDFINASSTAYVRIVNSEGAPWDNIYTATQSGYGRKTFEFTATKSTHYFACGGSAATGTESYTYDNIAVFPADAISRSDLVFLESWHEDVSEKDFVYPLGNTQYLGTTGDSGTPVAGAFAGSATYSLFSDTWQADSALVGKGYVWSTLSDANKKAFLANPENNCYLDGDKVIQARYRMRVVQGLGDSWSNIDSQNVGAYNRLSYYSTGILDIIAKGKQVSIVNDASTGTDASRFFGANNTGTLTGYIKENGVFATLQGAAAQVAYEGKGYALPIALVHRRNQGGYNLTYNPHGTRAMTVTPTNVADCFNQANLTMTTGYIGTSTPRPDGLFYDQVSVEDFKPANKGADIRSSAQEKQYKAMFDSWVAKDTAGKLTYYPITTEVSLTTLATDGTRTLAYSTTTGRVYYTNETAQYRTDAFIKLGAIL